MKKKITRFLAVLLAMLMIMPMSMTALATEDDSQGGGMTFDELGKKEADKLTEPGEYEITLSVPGAFEDDKYNEIIVMVDASLSQKGNFDSLKELIIGLGKKVLTADSSMKLTLMGFGVGPRYAGSFYSVAQLEEFLATATQEDLLQERSATNCEVGFEFVNDYINKSEKLKKTFVIYTSDGAANLDETPLDWSKWEDKTVFDYFGTFTIDDVISYIVETELEHIFEGNVPISATTAMFPKECADISVAQLVYGVGTDEYKEAIDVLAAKLEDQGNAYVSRVLQSIFECSGMEWGEEYSASDVEKAFQTYFRNYPGIKDSSYGSYMDLFYVILGDTGSKLLTNRYTRAAEASAALQQNEKVVGLYHVGYSGASNTWMNPEKGYYEGKDVSKLKYVYNTNFAEVVGNLLLKAEEMIITGYKDVTVTDPMSKWVTMDPASIRIYNGDTLIYENGEYITDDQPAKDPITITTNEDGHQQITWRVKDGYLLHTDRYNLRYVVNVNETVEGFEYGKEYPANDPTDVTYTDPDGEEHEEPIDVPNVKEEERPETIKEMGIKIVKEAKDTGKPISGIEFVIYKVQPAEGEVLETVPTAEEIAKYAVEDNKVEVLTTDEWGFASAELPEGTYMVVEQENDKVKAPVDPFYVSLPYPNPETGELEDIVTVNPKNELVDEEPDTPDPEVPTDPEDTTGKFSIIKHSSVEGDKLLKGAEFQILRAATDEEKGTEYSYNGQTIELVPATDKEGNEITLVTDENGYAVSPELEKGLYFLLEVKAPHGYELLEEVVPVYATSEGTTTDAIKIANKPGTYLPETGGPGTMMFTILGLVLCAGATAMCFKKRTYVG